MRVQFDLQGLRINGVEVNPQSTAGTMVDDVAYTILWHMVGEKEAKRYWSQFAVEFICKWGFPIDIEMDFYNWWENQRIR